MNQQDSSEWGGMELAEKKARQAYNSFDGGEYKEALEEIKIALEINPANSSWHFNKGLTLDCLDRFDEAIEEYELALSLRLDDLEALNCLGVNYIRTAQYDLAVKTFEKIQEIDSQYERGYCNRIILYGEMGLFDLAEQMFYLAQQIDSDCPLCFYNMGAILFDQRKYEKAIRCWQKTAKIDPEHPRTNHYLAKAYWFKGDGAKAQEYFLKELRLNPGNIEAIFDFGIALLELGNITSAKEKFNRILELRPSFTPALFCLGETALYDKSYGQAEILYEKALRQDKDMIGTRYRLACCSLIKGRKAEARKYLIQELSFDSKDFSVLTSMGSMFLTCNDFGSATYCLLRAIDCNAANSDAYYYLGIISAKKGELKDAIGLLNQALELSPGNTFFLQALALVYSMANKLEDALSLVNLVKTIAKDSFAPQLKQFRRRLCLAQAVQGRSKRVKRFLLSKIEQRALNHVSSITHEVYWYPSDNWLKYRERKPDKSNFFRRTESWKGQ